MSRTTSYQGFSLVEVTIAMGIAAFCLIAVFGLLPIGMLSHRNAIGQTAAVSILSSVVADMRATAPSSSTSPQYGIQFGTSQTLYADSSGGIGTTPSAVANYRLTIDFPPSPAGAAAPTFAHLRITWPATADPTNAIGSSETLAAFDRH